MEKTDWQRDGTSPGRRVRWWRAMLGTACVAVVLAVVTAISRSVSLGFAVCALGGAFAISALAYHRTEPSRARRRILEKLRRQGERVLEDLCDGGYGPEALPALRELRKAYANEITGLRGALRDVRQIVATYDSLIDRRNHLLLDPGTVAVAAALAPLAARDGASHPGEARPAMRRLIRRLDRERQYLAARAGRARDPGARTLRDDAGALLAYALVTRGGPSRRSRETAFLVTVEGARVVLARSRGRWSFEQDALLGAVRSCLETGMTQELGALRLSNRGDRWLIALPYTRAFFVDRRDLAALVKYAEEKLAAREG